MEKVINELSQVEEECRKTYETIMRIVNLGILYRPINESHYGFYKSVPRYGRKEYGWEKEFVPVVQLYANKKVVAWAPDISNPEKVIRTLLRKYQEKNEKVSQIEL